MKNSTKAARVRCPELLSQKLLKETPGNLFSSARALYRGKRLDVTRKSHEVLGLAELCSNSKH